MILAIDIGTYKVSFAIGTVDQNGFVVVNVADMVESKGFYGGKIIDHDRATETIWQVKEKVRKKIESRSSKKITEVWCTMSGLKTISTWSKSRVSIASGYVTKNDINRVIGQCMQDFKQDNADKHREFLHVLPHTYMIDSVNVKNPYKHKGGELSAHVLICRGDATILNNIHSVFEDCKVKINGIAVDGYMSALAVLDAQELDLDLAMCIDMGDSTLSSSLFYQGELVWCKNFAFGAGHVIDRIMHETSMPRKMATKIISQAPVLAENLPYADANTIFTYTRIAEQDAQYEIPVRHICKIMYSEYHRMFKQIKDTIPPRFGDVRRVVLTGGGAKTRDISDLATQVMRANVRLGLPHRVVWNDNRKESISPALIGLIKYSQNHISISSQSYIRQHRTEYTGTVVSRVAQWFKNNI